MGSPGSKTPGAAQSFPRSQQSRSVSYLACASRSEFMQGFMCIMHQCMRAGGQVGRV